MRYTLKPHTIEAIEFKGNYREDQELFRRLRTCRYRLVGYDRLQLRTALSGWLRATPGDFIVFHPAPIGPVVALRQDFLDTYDPVIEA